MLQRTFQHIQTVGPSTERKIWTEGLATWEHFLRADKFPRLRQDVEESMTRYKGGQWSWFDRLLPAATKWRAFDDFRDRALYVDIETNGGITPDDITVIGTFDGREFRAFVADENLDDALEFLESFPLLVTFNGSQFDLPVIRRRFQNNLFNHIHVDLRFTLQQLGLRGGLKHIEQVMGLERSNATRGLGGWDAVRLWHEHRQGSREALELLLAYNREDVENLRPLMEHAAMELGRGEGEK